jgi:hypothetical protein
MPSRSRDYRFIVLALALAVGAYYVALYLQQGSNEVNAHNPAVGRIATFELQPGEVGVAVRVRLGRQPVPATDVWSDRSRTSDDEDAPDEPYRHGQTDRDGLVRVPVRKGATGVVQLFARDAAGRVGGASVSPDRLLSAPDVVLVDVAPRTGRLLTADGQPIPGATLTAESFSAPRPGEEVVSAFIEVPEPVQPQYTTRTGADGRFSLPGVPVGFNCRLAFQTVGYGEGTIWLPAGATGEYRLARAGAVRVRVSADGSAADVKRLWCQINPVGIPDLSPDAPRVEGYRSRRHDGSDSFLLANVVPGEYRLRIEGTPRNPVQPEKIARVTVEPGATADVVIPLKRAGRLAGRIVDGDSGEGIGNVRLYLFARAPDDLDYGGRVTTDDGGRFSGYVPAGLPLGVSLDRAPRGYAVRLGPLIDAWSNARPVLAASDETTTLPAIKLHCHGAIAGTVVADGRPVPDAVVEVRWDESQQRKPATVKTDAAGRFQVPGAPPGRAAVIRVRVGGKVNENVRFSADDLAGPVTIGVAEGNAFRVRGQVTDSRGRPVGRAKVVVAAVVRPRPAAPPAVPPAPPALPQDADDEPDEPEGPARRTEAQFYQPAEVEAVFTDAAGRFESGPLWPGCVYTLTVSADGFAPRLLREVEGRAGQTHDFPPVVLSGTSAAVAGTVVGPDGRSLAGATVINSGDAPKRLTAATDAAGRFSLAGLYDGPAVLVAHKPGYRWGYTVARPGEPEPKIVLRPLTDPPATIPAPTDEQRRAETDLVRRLTKLVPKDLAPPGAPPPDRDPWAEARKDLDGYLAKLAKQDGTWASQNLTALARELAKDDRAKAVRVLQEAAAAARRVSVLHGQGAELFGQMAFDASAFLRVDALTRVAETADDLGLRAEAGAWLAEAEALVLRLPEAQRPQSFGRLAVGWVRLDPARAEKFLAAAGPEPISRDMAVGAVVDRLLWNDPAQAVPWLDRFKRPGDTLAQSYRSRVAVRLAERDLPQAVRLGEGITDPVYRALTLTRLATAVPRDDSKQAHALIEKAAAAVVAGPGSQEFEPEHRMGLAVYLLWQAQAVAYPDLPSLVAVALTTRPPVPAHERQTETWRSQTIELTVGVGSVDPPAGRALLGPDPGRDKAHGQDPEDGGWDWFLALALADPVAATRFANDDLDPDQAAGALAVLKKRSAVIERLHFLERLWWVRDDPDAAGVED